MKRNDSGDFSVLYVEPGDEKASLLQVISGQKKPVVIMLAEQSRLFQRPDDFATLKHVKRQLDLPIVFVIPTSTHLAQLAARNGFPVYLSMDSLADALSAGQLGRARTNGKTDSLPRPEATNRGNAEAVRQLSSPKKTVPLPLLEETTRRKQTEPLHPRDVSQLFAAPAQPLSPPPPAAPQESFPAVRFNSLGGVPPSWEDAHVDEDEDEASAFWTPQQIKQPTGNLRSPSLQPSGSQPKLAPQVPKQPSGTQSVLGANAPGQQSGALRVGLPKQPSGAQPALGARGVRQPSGEQAALRAQRLRQASGAQPKLKTAPLQPPMTFPQPPQTKTGKGRPFPLLLVILTGAVVFAGLGLFLMFAHTLPSTSGNGSQAVATTTVGHISFTSSEQLSENTSNGIEDQVVVDLNHLVPPAPHKNYYAWLLGDRAQNDPTSIPLGALSVTNGTAHLFYGGDAQHSNLLLLASRFLVTEEDAAIPPISPSLDTTTWRYYGEFSTTPINSPDNTKHFSYLDHLRHLLGSDPTLNELELPGGLNNWFYRNSGKVLEWVSSTRETWNDTKDTAFIRRQTMRALEYLDGTSFVYQDIPANTPLLVDERLARIGLLDVNGANQDPPCYLTHIENHLNGLLQSGAVTPNLRTNASGLITALNNVQFWLGKVRQDGKKIMSMSDDQLKQGDTLTVLNDMIDNTNHAYSGQLDPSTNTMRNGAVWVHDHMQTLSQLTITKYTLPQGTSHQMVPMAPRVFVPFRREDDVLQ
ncbi:hypothetical protein [Tengunoibacter tsumagoiensis]|uniref:Uncharacterized protein n=1 Tax=Tengunoibacter tsumagoiensis TaxID=2014871 RepID=A0A402A644_9CHLR|nr:hypothetical protein [Tengunoibacter tsumagoiensis]GCE14600.1 hypothetical protein KTT_44590 [Tengunoibacter tsumagoiensis]